MRDATPADMFRMIGIVSHLHQALADMATAGNRLTVAQIAFMSAISDMTTALGEAEKALNDWKALASEIGGDNNVE